MKHQAECDRPQVHERRTDQSKVCNVRRGSSESAFTSRITYHEVVPPVPQLQSGDRIVVYVRGGLRIRCLSCGPRADSPWWCDPLQGANWRTAPENANRPPQNSDRW